MKRSLFGSRRERFADDPTQTLLLETRSPASPPAEGRESPAEDKKKRTSKGRQARVYPDFMPREERKQYLDPADVPEDPWKSFTRFLESGAVPMDNNAAKRALKYPILGRKA